MIVYTYLVCVLFSLWFLCTIIVQFKESKLTEKIKNYDTFSLLPLWTFFAPNPGVNDYHLLYRDENKNGERTSWEEIEINENRKLLTCLWNPSKRSKKVLSDVIQNIIPMIREFEEKPQIMMFTMPYLLILNAILKEPCMDKQSCKKQFLLSATDGYENSGEPKLILISEFHPI